METFEEKIGEFCVNKVQRMNTEKDQIKNQNNLKNGTVAANQDVHALTQKSSSILLNTYFKFQLETNALHF